MEKFPSREEFNAVAHSNHDRVGIELDDKRSKTAIKRDKIYAIIPRYPTLNLTLAVIKLLVS